ncbi:MAG: diheme cytochrome c [Alcanivoracaceae bacterium]|nr:diheme cytochrome c [Alcanivoracaceae bacterium]
MKIIVSTLLIFALLLTTSIIMGGNSFHEREEYDSEDNEFQNYSFRQPGVAPVSNTYYVEECGSCHFAYPPGLLPASSWGKLMKNLGNHFDENAELNKNMLDELTQYLVKNSADKSNFKRSKRIMRSLGKSDSPLRITETLYFVRKHDEIPYRMVSNTSEVRSFSHCTACHTHAIRGYFNEHEVRIPGYGKWED